MLSVKLSGLILALVSLFVLSLGCCFHWAGKNESKVCTNEFVVRILCYDILNFSLTLFF